MRARGFEWLLADDSENSVFAWVRHGGDGRAPVAVVSNFTPLMRENYILPLPKAGRWREVINTDSEAYWGTGRGNLGTIEGQAKPTHGKPASASITLPPLATLYFVCES